MWTNETSGIIEKNIDYMREVGRREMWGRELLKFISVNFVVIKNLRLSMGEKEAGDDVDLNEKGSGHFVVFKNRHFVLKNFNFKSFDKILF